MSHRVASVAGHSAAVAIHDAEPGRMQRLATASSREHCQASDTRAIVR
jgi:hypothetical protein